MNRNVVCKSIALGIVCLIAAAGCGNKNIARVKGTVRFAGAPVHGGTLVFSPIGDGKVGRPASATVNADGSFTLGTERDADGALIGRHRVVFTPPAQQLTEEQRTDRYFVAPPPDYYGMIPREEIVEVKAGHNEVAIELMPMPQQ
jgi:hypothetical protein